MDYAELRAKLQEWKDAEQARGGAMFMGIPDRWYEHPRWRCCKGHVRSGYLKSEAVGADLCFECGERVALSFPEDRDGPLPLFPKPPGDGPGQAGFFTGNIDL